MLSLPFPGNAPLLRELGRLAESNEVLEAEPAASLVEPFLEAHVDLRPGCPSRRPLPEELPPTGASWIATSFGWGWGEGRCDSGCRRGRG